MLILLWKQIGKTFIQILLENVIVKETFGNNCKINKL